jgi:hypothetical protein
MSILFNKRVQTGQDVSPPVLSFTSIPPDVTIDFNGSASLNSTAVATNQSTGTSATGTVTYQWYRNGSPISGATSAILTLTNQTTAAQYYCIANFTPSGKSAPAINGPITSRTVTTTIRNYITITSQPTSRTITIGSNATFNISAIANDGNNASLKYEWFVNNILTRTTTGGTSSSLTLSTPAIGSYSIYCKVSQGGVTEFVAPSVNSNTVTLTVNDFICLFWDDSRKLGGQINVSTNSGLKSGPVSVWYGPWSFGTSNDTCYIYLDLEVRDIYPRAVNSSTDKPFIAAFQCRVRTQGGSDALNAFKILEWNGNSRFDNENNKQTLRFSSDDFNGQRVVAYSDGGGIIFDRTNTSATRSLSRASWNPSWGTPVVDILFLASVRKENGQNIDSFLTVASSRTDNILEYGRRYDPNA